MAATEKTQMIGKLNKLLAGERAAIIQYDAHRARGDFAQYKKFASSIESRSKQESEHTMELQERILDLGGAVESNVDPIHIATEFDIEKMIDNDLKAEEKAVGDYTDAAVFAARIGDELSRALLSHILGEEREHMRYLQAQKLQIEQMGCDNFLGTLV